MLSLWQDSIEEERRERLHGNIKTDVLVIGAGIAGLLCAYKLKDAGVDCTVVEAERVFGGNTGNTTAKITFQHGLIYSRLINEFGTERARMYLEANRSALEEYKRLCRNIDCDFEETDSYVYSRDNRKKLEKELEACDKIGYKAELAENLSLPFETMGAVRFTGQAQFNPLKFLKEISKDLKIYENTAVTGLRGLTAETRYGSVKAQKIIVATHFPFINKHGSYFLKMYQQRSYVAAFSGAQPLSGVYIDERTGGFSFRRSGEMLLIGEGSHRTGKPTSGWQKIRDFAAREYPRAEERYFWAAQDCMTLDGVPNVGNYSANTPDFYVITGFNKWGMTSSLAAADLMRDLIIGRDNPYKQLFNPSRGILRPQLALNGAEAVMNLLTFSKKRCPHLGCALKWNPAEHSWDCPCHGSRFSEKGKKLDNPANGDIEI